MMHPLLPTIVALVRDVLMLVLPKPFYPTKFWMPENAFPTSPLNPNRRYRKLFKTNGKIGFLVAISVKKFVLGTILHCHTTNLNFNRFPVWWTYHEEIGKKLLHNYLKKDLRIRLWNARNGRESSGMCLLFRVRLELIRERLGVVPWVTTWSRTLSCDLESYPELGDLGYSGHDLESYPELQLGVVPWVATWSRTLS